MTEDGFSLKEKMERRFKCKHTTIDGRGERATIKMLNRTIKKSGEEIWYEGDTK